MQIIFIPLESAFFSYLLSEIFVQIGYFFLRVTQEKSVVFS